MATPTNNLKNLLYNYLISNPTQIYFSLGKTTAWTDDSSPDQESVNANNIQEIQYYIQASKAVPIHSLDTPGTTTTTTTTLSPSTTTTTTTTSAPISTITFKGKTYEVMDSTKLDTDNVPDAVYFTTTFTNSDVSITNEFRQYGLNLGVNASTLKTILQPSEISNTGTLIEYANISPIYPQSNSQITLSFIIPIETLIAS